MSKAAPGAFSFFTLYLLPVAGVAPVLSCAVAHQGQVKEGARCYNSEKAFSQTLAIPVQRIYIGPASLFYSVALPCTLYNAQKSKYVVVKSAAVALMLLSCSLIEKHSENTTGTG